MTNVAQGRERRGLVNRVKESLRGLRTELSLLNRRVSGHLELRDGDLDLMELIARLGPMGPSALAKLAGLHPATMTGVLDRLEKGGWLARERDPQDRRGVLLRIRRERVAEIFAMYGGMNKALDDLCARYTDEQLELIADFLTRATAEGRNQTKDLDPP